MVKNLEFNEEKNIWLKETRGVNFDDVLEAIKKNKVLDDISHLSTKYKHQRVLIIQIKKYIYAVPYVKNEEGILFLKTMYPSRVLAKKYLKK